MYEMPSYTLEDIFLGGLSPTYHLFSPEIILKFLKEGNNNTYHDLKPHTPPPTLPIIWPAHLVFVELVPTTCNIDPSQRTCMGDGVEEDDDHGGDPMIGRCGHLYMFTIGICIRWGTQTFRFTFWPFVVLLFYLTSGTV